MSIFYLGRENELKLITDYMNESLNFNNDLHKDLKKDVKRKFIIVSGDNGIGKVFEIYFFLFKFFFLIFFYF